MLEPKRYRCFEKTKLVTAIKAFTVEAEPVKGLAILDQPFERVGQLDLAAAARLRACQADR